MAKDVSGQVGKGHRTRPAQKGVFLRGFFCNSPVQVDGNRKSILLALSIKRKDGRMKKGYVLSVTIYLEPTEERGEELARRVISKIREVVDVKDVGDFKVYY